jgi:hypothetical protein
MVQSLESYEETMKRIINDHLDVCERILRATVNGRCASTSDIENAQRYCLTIETIVPDMSGPPYRPLYKVYSALLPTALSIKKQTDEANRPP